MPDPVKPPSRPGALVPRLGDTDYTRDGLAERRRWVEAQTGVSLPHVGAYSIPSEQWRGNVENPIGAVQVPLGVCGPLLLHGEHAEGMFYVPLATTEGALLRSCERGMTALTRAGGVHTRVWLDENRVAPIFRLAGIAEAREFARAVDTHFPEIRAAAEATTRHGKLLRVECHPVGREVIVELRFGTGDAHGMNLIVRAAEAACRWLLENTAAEAYQLFSGFEGEKHAGPGLLAGGKGKKVTAGARLGAALVRSYLHTTPQAMAELWRQTALGHFQGGMTGYNAHYANSLTALFLATGQDVANVINSALGLTTLEVTPEGDLWASVTLSSLTVATVGGGTGLGTARECLEMLGCVGGGKALKLAEIAAATVLAGELSMGAALASGEFVAAHETYGRNRPTEPGS